ncbi:hypothetical protein IZ6_15770 [Terrihabitans soli]|uniref:DUF4148 domain-containing protein n=1 Tax=Terrihabitans soli TaxID=708113 RepID=A0A6S6QUA4_9HYPH|nr:hypothetical protein [Terrihabitans soli]BCJ90842.1 hypothetical protein IZ6_15770 [Terrihabitans soli]
MTSFSRALILAGLVSVAGVSGALADGSNRNAARINEGAQASQQAPVLQEGRSAAVEGYLQKQENRNFLTDRRSSDDNN